MLLLFSTRGRLDIWLNLYDPKNLKHLWGEIYMRRDIRVFIIEEDPFAM